MQEDTKDLSGHKRTAASLTRKTSDSYFFSKEWREEATGHFNRLTEDMISQDLLNLCTEKLDSSNLTSMSHPSEDEYDVIANTLLANLWEDLENDDVLEKMVQSNYDPPGLPITIESIENNSVRNCSSGIKRKSSDVFSCTKCNGIAEAKRFPASQDSVFSFRSCNSVNEYKRTSPENASCTKHLCLHKQLGRKCICLNRSSQKSQECNDTEGMRGSNKDEKVLNEIRNSITTYSLFNCDFGPSFGVKDGEAAACTQLAQALQNDDALLAKSQSHNLHQEINLFDKKQLKPALDVTFADSDSELGPFNFNNEDESCGNQDDLISTKRASKDIQNLSVTFGDYDISAASPGQSGYNFNNDNVNQDESFVFDMSSKLPTSPHITFSKSRLDNWKLCGITESRLIDSASQPKEADMSLDTSLNDVQYHTYCPLNNTIILHRHENLVSYNPINNVTITNNNFRCSTPNANYAINGALEFSFNEFNDVLCSNDEPVPTLTYELLHFVSEATNLSNISMIPESHPNLVLDKKTLMKNKIEGIFLGITTALVQGLPYTFVFPYENRRSDCFGEDNSLKRKGRNNLQVTRMSSRNSSCIYSTTVYALAKIYSLLQNETIYTYRELYYLIKDCIPNRVGISTIMNRISSILDTDPWDLPVVPTSKGLVCGDLTIEYEDKFINCDIPDGILIPHDITKIKQLKSNATLILVLEKDAVFKKLLNEDVLTQIPENLLLVTGKGYPDINTRLFLKKLEENLKIPILILVDGDPHGINIMLTYRFGSLEMSRLSDKLSVSSMKWLGIHPSEFQSLNITQRGLTHLEVKLTKNMLKRPEVEGIPQLKNELETLLRNKVKADIEGVIKCDFYLTDFYLANKLKTKDYF